MLFYLDHKTTRDAGIKPVVLPAGDALPPAAETGMLYLRQGRQALHRFEAPGEQLILVGDPVFSPRDGLFQTIVAGPGDIRLDALFREIKGHYYWFYTGAGRFCCGSSFGAIFPVYYSVAGDRLTISSSSYALAGRIDAGAQDKRNLLERLLFNYPFFDSTWWSGIKLLDAHRYLHCDGQNTTVKGNFEVSDYFGSPENASRDSLHELAQLFQSETRLFFPDSPFGISLTGGFDGRTLVAAARKERRPFFAYSFGRPDSTDVTLPAKQAAALQVPYFPVPLDERYLEQNALASARAFMRLTDFNGNFGRPHYHHAAEALSEKTGHILTGNFGSELFRALHIPGVMMSECLIRIFAAPDDSWKDFLRRAAQGWDRDFFHRETEELIAGIEAYVGKMKGWEPNHKFYRFVFNEIFRKYFGPELVMQSEFLNNRTPYLNLHFFEQLNRTIWSGVHSRIFEKTKRKRMKGQLFYATFIKQSDPALYRMNTNKGYSPADVLETWRLPLLLAKVVAHKYLFYKDIDDNSVSAFFNRYHSRLAEEIAENPLPPFMQAFFGDRKKRAPAFQNPDSLIKVYSIAAGWSAASRQTTPPAPAFLTG